MKHARPMRWQILFAVLLGMLAAAPLTLVTRAHMEFFSPIAVAGPTTNGRAGNNAFTRPIKIGMSYIPSAHVQGDRIYAEEGFESDLAQAIGERLNTAVDLVPVSASERSQTLSDGQIDVLIARVASHDPLHQSAQILLTGYESGLSPVVRTDRPLRGWDDLAGKVVCVTEANEHGQKLARTIGANVRTFRAPAQALMLVRTGECAAAIHDRAVLDPLFRKMAWQKFSATLPPVEPTSLVVAVGQGRSDLARSISRALADIGSAAEWQKRREKWASLVAFEVYRDQVAGDCH